MTKQTKQTCEQCGKDSANSEGYCVECDYTTKQAHTPTPWEAINEDTAGDGMFSIVPQRSGGTIASIYGDTKLEAKSNASFIVQACNSHEELLSFVRYYGSLSGSERSDKHINSRLSNRAKALTIKAEAH